MSKLARMLGCLLVALLAACAQVGDGPPPQNMASANPDRFTFNIEATGALSGQSTDERARKEIEFYRTHHGYNSYEIVSKTPQGSPPTTVQYEVQFAR